MPTPDRDAQRPALWRLGLLFGVVYFVQGIGEPTEGMLIQPVRSALREKGQSPAEITAFAALLALPWALKPLFGLLTDCVPLFGTRRKSYLILTSAVAALALGGLALWPVDSWSTTWLLVGLWVPTLAVACGDVVTDALVVDVGQPLGLTGRLVSIQWASLFAATVLAGLGGGYLTEHREARLGLLICAALSALTLVLSVVAVNEPHAIRQPATSGNAVSRLGQAARSPSLLVVGAILFLWNFNPCSTTIIHLHLTGPLGLSEQFYGQTQAVLAGGCLVASLAYAGYCERVPVRWLVHASIVLGILGNLVYGAVADRTSALVVSAIVGLATWTASLIQIDLAARSCPADLAGTTFALLMALANLGLILSTWLGGPCYELATARWGSATAFWLLAAAGAVVTAGCWLVMPILPRDSNSGAATRTGPRG